MFFHALLHLKFSRHHIICMYSKQTKKYITTPKTLLNNDSYFHLMLFININEKNDDGAAYITFLCFYQRWKIFKNAVMFYSFF